MDDEAAAYDPRHYWQERHRRLTGDARSVGNKGRSAAENEAAFERRAVDLRRLVAAELGNVRGRTVVELGCGVGRVAEVLLDLGFRYTGVDISPEAIDQARRICRGGTFLIGDALGFDGARGYDTALAAHLLCHMVDPVHWRRALASLAGSLRTGGALILIERLPQGAPEAHADYVLHRTRDETARALAELGLTLVPESSLGSLHIAWAV